MGLGFLKFLLSNLVSSDNTAIFQAITNSPQFQVSGVNNAVADFIAEWEPILIRFRVNCPKLFIISQNFNDGFNLYRKGVSLLLMAIISFKNSCCIALLVITFPEL